jgi:hypothetical protein
VPLPWMCMRSVRSAEADCPCPQMDLRAAPSVAFDRARWCMWPDARGPAVGRQLPLPCSPRHQRLLRYAIPLHSCWALPSCRC